MYFATVLVLLWDVLPLCVVQCPLSLWLLIIEQFYEPGPGGAVLWARDGRSSSMSQGWEEQFYEPGPGGAVL